MIVSYMDANPSVGTPTPLEFVVMPDPIDSPNQPLVSMNSFSTAVSSVDALDWRGDYANGDYSVRVLATHHELQFYQPPGIVGQPLPDPYLVPKTYVKRMNWDYNATATEPVYSHQNFGTHTHDKVAEFSGPLRVRGLSYFGSWAGYLTYNTTNSKWMIGRATPLTSGNDSLNTITPPPTTMHCQSP